MVQDILSELEALFLALSDRTRLQLLRLMGSDEVSVGFLCDSLQQSQPKISRHLAYLRSAGIVSTRRDGKWIYYRIAPPVESSARAILSAATGWIAVDGIQTSGFPAAEPVYAGFSEDDQHQEGEFTPNELEVYLL